MTLTLFGVVTILISLWLMLRASALAQFTFVIITFVFGGAAAINLPALGGSSIRPSLLAFILLFGRLILTPSGELSAILRAVRKNLPLIVFCAYGILGALILPRVFQGQIDVVPMRPLKFRTDLVEKFPLIFSSQNFTAAFYLGGTLLGALVGDIIARRHGAHRRLADAVVAASWLHIGFGLLGVVLKPMGLEQVLNFFRNGAYAQLDHAYKGYVRITGIMPEASAYADFAFAMLAITTELWLRGIRERWTGFTSLGLLVILVLSSSSSAYVGLAGYAVVMLLRWLVFPQGLGVRKGAVLLACAVGAGVAVGIMLMIFPAAAAQVGDMLKHMTLDKADSQSANERGIWARQGWEAFLVSYGLGVGPGSFRSSSIVMALLGSVGLIGALAFLWYLMRVLKPWRNSTFHPPPSEVQAAGVAVGWAVLIGIIPALVNSPSPDPGVLFAVTAAMSLVWRDARERARARPPVQAPGPVASPASGLA